MTDGFVACEPEDTTGVLEVEPVGVVTASEERQWRLGMREAFSPSCERCYAWSMSYGRIDR
jgi:hypothetical protein